MQKYSVPRDLLQKLRCASCDEYLSQLPILLYQDQPGAVCGRCPVITDFNPMRDVAYETLAQVFTFPCRHAPHGCLELLQPTQVQAHEESCKYRQYFCPFLPLAFCPWQGPCNELIDHYEDKHGILLLHEPSFEIDFINKYEDNFLLPHKNELFLIQMKSDAKDGQFWCCVRYIGDKNAAQKYLYQMVLHNHRTPQKVSLPIKPVESDSEMTLDKSKAVHVITDNVRIALEDPVSVICNVTILPNDKLSEDCDANAEVIKEAKTTITSEGVDENILRELECPVCSEYMVPPIHQCVSGHSICSRCKPQVAECPTCRNVIGNTRNFVLEKMTTMFKYLCKYYEYNCPFVSTSEHIKQHEEQCKFGPYSCPFDDFESCNWKGKLTDVAEHAKKCHADQVLDMDVINFSILDDCDEYDDCLLITAHGEVFRLCFQYESMTFYWTVQYVGPSEDAEKYQYEIDVIDNSNSKQRLFLRRNCKVFTKYEDAFAKCGGYVSLPFSLLETMLENGSNLTYKCHIIKI